MSAIRFHAGRTLPAALFATLLVAIPGRGAEESPEASLDFLLSEPSQEQPREKRREPNAATDPLTGDPAPPVPGQRADSPVEGPFREIEEVIVTATRREANTQDVAIAITTLGADAIDDREIRNVSDLQFQVPGLVYGQAAGQAQITLRGIGVQLQNISIEPGVAMYVDGVYLGRPYLSNSALYDLERVEVLRGPQGTLFGRNATGGLIHFVTAPPTEELTASGAFLGGSLEQLRGRASVAGPIIDSVASGRLSFVGERNQGWLENLANGSTLKDQRSGSVRGGVDLYPMDSLKVRIGADYQSEDLGSPILAALTPNIFTGDTSNAEIIDQSAALFGPLSEQAAAGLQELGDNGFFVAGRRSTDPRKVYNDVNGDSDLWFGGVTLDATADLGFVETHAIGAYRSSKYLSVFEIDGTDFPAGRVDRLATADQLSGELHFFSSYGGWLDWLVGGYSFYEESFEDDPVSLFLSEDQPDGAGQLIFFGSQDTLSLAGFAEATAEILWGVSLTLGGRYTVDEKTFKETSTSRFGDEEFDNCRDLETKATWSELTPKIGLQWAAAEELLVYGSWSKGFKAGGLNLSGCGARYEPEILKAYEAGIKSQWLSNTLRANLAGFFYEYQDYQNLRLEDLREIVTNAQDAEVRGVELELLYTPREWLSLSGSGSWLDTEFIEFFDMDPFDPSGEPKDLSGNRLVRSPEWSFNLGVEGSLPVGNLGLVSPRFEWNWVDDFFFTAFNRPQSAQNAFHFLNAFVGFSPPDGSLFLRGFVKNLTDAAVLDFATESGEILGVLGEYGPPRTWGIEIGFGM